MRNINHTIIISQLIFIVLITACKNNNETEPFNNPNECTMYSCPIHKDKMNVEYNKCIKCGLPMINTNFMESYFMHSTNLAYDSIANYHKKIVEYANKIILNDPISKESQTKNIISAKRNLNKAIFVTENIEKLTFGKRQLAMKHHFEKIKKLYAVATYHITAISNEIAKNNINKTKIKLYTEELKGTIYEVDKEQNIIKIKK